MNKGDWVQVWGQVKKTGEGVHPDDVVVEFFSHNEQYVAHVRRDRVELPARLPEWVTSCTALRASEGGTLHLCIHHEGHGEDHESADGTHFGEGHEHRVVGYFEEAI